MVGGRRVIAGVSGSLRSLGALRAGEAEARSRGAALLAVLAWAPAGGEVAYMRAPCPLLLRLWEQAARERLQESFDAVFGGIPPDVTVRTMVVRARPGPLLLPRAGRAAARANHRGAALASSLAAGGLHCPPRRLARLIAC